jgi:hypothetical protein
MGWVISSVDGRTLISHGGNSAVMSSFTVLDTLTHTAASILYGGPPLDPYQYPGQFWLVNNLLHLANGQPSSVFGRPTDHDPTRNVYELPAALLDRYAGTYLSAEGFRATITRAPRRDELLVYIDAGTIRFGATVDFLSPTSAVLRNVSGSAPVNFSMTPAGIVTGLAGGVPGGVLRKRSADELARVRTVRSPSDRIRLSVQPDWNVSFAGDSFIVEPRSKGATQLHGALVARLDSLAGHRGYERSETIGQQEWRRRSWAEVLGKGGTTQHLRFHTRVGDGWFVLHAVVPAGQLTATLRDVIVPLLASLEFPVARQD